MNMKKIDLYKVHMAPKEELMSELEKVLYSGMITEGAKVKEFEEKFQQIFGLEERPLSVNSGTAALQLSYRLMGVKNRIVLTSPMTCFANVCSIVNEGGKIVWCDVDPSTGNIDIKDVEKKAQEYGRRVACVSVVDLAGYPVDYDKLSSVCYKSDLNLVEDAAQSLGAKWNNQWIGSARYALSHHIAYSFQAIKHLTTVDGGMLVVKDFSEFDLRDLSDMAKKLKWFGINRESAKEETRWNYDIEECGYKFHMNNVNAVIGLVQLNHTLNIVNKHKENGKYFDKELKNISGVKLVDIPEKSEPSYWIYPLRVERKEDFAQMMKSRGIAVNIAHVRNDSYSVCKNWQYVLNHREELPGMNEYEKEYIFIPCGWWVNSEECEYIVEVIKKGW